MRRRLGLKKELERIWEKDPIAFPCHITGWVIKEHFSRAFSYWLEAVRGCLTFPRYPTTKKRK